MPAAETVPMFDWPDEPPANLPAEAADAYRKEPVSETWRARVDAAADRCCCCGAILPVGHRYVCGECVADEETVTALNRLIERLRADRSAKEANR